MKKMKKKIEHVKSRYFNGMRFVYSNRSKTKKGIEKMKAAWKKHSQYVRVIKSKGEYVLYTRKRI